MSNLKSKVSKLAHLRDIDFRSREERQKMALVDFKNWYETLLANQDLAFSERTQGQLTMLSSVLWYLLPESEYKELTSKKF